MKESENYAEYGVLFFAVLLLVIAAFWSLGAQEARPLDPTIEFNAADLQETAGACIFEVAFFADTVMIGWDRPWPSANGPVCPDWDNRNPEAHTRIKHSRFVPKCPKLWAVTSWYGVPGPMVEQDMSHPLCNEKKADQ